MNKYCLLILLILLSLSACSAPEQAGVVSALPTMPEAPAVATPRHGTGGRPEKWPTPTCNPDPNSFNACPGQWAYGSVGYLTQTPALAAPSPAATVIYVSPPPQPTATPAPVSAPPPTATPDPLRPTMTALALSMLAGDATATAAVGQAKLTEVAGEKAAAATLGAQRQAARDQFASPFSAWFLPIAVAITAAVLIGLLLFAGAALIDRVRAEARTIHADAKLVEAQAEVLRAGITAAPSADNSIAREILVLSWQQTANPQTANCRKVVELLSYAFLYWLEEYQEQDASQAWTLAMGERHIPTDSKLGMSGGEWQEAVNLLKNAEDASGDPLNLVTATNQGTTVSITLGQLQSGINAGSIIIR